MARTWATFGVDLHLELAGRKVRASLERALRDAVRSGRLGAGVRLPSSRALAGDLGVARNTVAGAYSQLVAEGWLAAAPGSSTRVAERVTVLAAAAPFTAAIDVEHPRYDLRAGYPDLSSFPRSTWLAALRRALSSAPYGALGYSGPQGLPELRTALAGYLARARGVLVGPERIVVCSGFTQGLSLLCHVLRSQGATTLATEAFGHQAHRSVAAAGGLNLRLVPVDELGADTSQLGDADAVLLTPAHQFPLGVALGPRRRAQAVEWVRDTGGAVIEDDYDGEFRYDRQPVGAMQALAPEHVIYAGTVSKSLAPGIRIGWLVPPSHLVDGVAAAKAEADRQSGALDQLALAELIVSGAYDRHVRRSRLAYRRRRDRLVAALRQQAPEVRVTGIAAGLHALLELPPGQGEDELVAQAARHGLAIEGLGHYDATGGHHRPALVVGYATLPGHAFTGALAPLCTVLNGPVGATPLARPPSVNQATDDVSLEGPRA
jgi:GntR family transcriptional regulator/MocR family aminotransferase